MCRILRLSKALQDHCAHIEVMSTSAHAFNVANSLNSTLVHPWWCAGLCISASWLARTMAWTIRSSTKTHRLMTIGQRSSSRTQKTHTLIRLRDDSYRL